MKIIVVTGSTGFIGKSLKHFFEGESLKYNFIPISRNELSKPLVSFTYPSSTIIHLAGKAHDIKKKSNSDEYYTVNTKLTEKVFDSFLNSPASVFIMMSSVKAASDRVVGSLTEDALPIPDTDYGKSKLLAESYILSKKIPVNKRVYILRPCIVYGPENKGNLNLLFKIVKKGIPWPLGSYENQRSFCSIFNLCFIIKELIDNPKIPSGIYNVADDETISTNQLIRIIAEALNKKARILNVPKNLIHWLSVFGDKFNLPLNSDRLQKLTENFIVSNEKITKAIDKTMPYRSKDELFKTIQSFQEYAK
jgi:nucleoside-diphosphate-sugar epimerase